MSYIKKTLSLSIVHRKCDHEYEKIFKEEESNKKLKIISLNTSTKECKRMYYMPEETIIQEFRLKTINETRNYFIEEVNQNKLISNKYKWQSSELHWTFTDFSFCSCWMYFHFCFGFFSCYFYRNYKLCNKTKNLYNNCRNKV